MKWLPTLILLSVSMLTRAETVEFVHTDPLGSPVAISNQAGQVIARMQYEPYGANIGQGAVDRPGYTGHVMDGATGLTYMQQRYYEPIIGRFMSRDPVAADRNNGANFNAYWYANNNPYMFIDPDGREIVVPPGLPRDFYENVAKAIRHEIRNNGAREIGEVHAMKEKVFIRPTSDRGDATLSVFKRDTVYWSDKAGLEVTDKDSGKKGVLSPATIFVHELGGHARNAMLDTADFNEQHRTPVGNGWQNAEEKRVIEGPERRSAIRNGEPLRSRHDEGRSVPVRNPCNKDDCP